jgi:hypothetical protein
MTLARVRLRLLIRANVIFVWWGSVVYAITEEKAVQNEKGNLRLLHPKFPKLFAMFGLSTYPWVA